MEAEKMETERIDVIESESDAEGFADAFMARGILGLMDYDINLQVH